MDYELPGQLERKPIKLAIDSDSSSDDEDALASSGRRTSAEPGAADGAKKGRTRDVGMHAPAPAKRARSDRVSDNALDCDADVGNRRQAGASQNRKAATSVVAVDLDADDEEEDQIQLDPDELEDPDARARRLALERARQSFSASAAVNLDEEPEPVPTATVDDDEDDVDFSTRRLRVPHATAPPPPPPAVPTPKQRVIRLAVRCGQADPIKVKTYYDQPLGKLIEKLKGMRDVNPNQARLLFDGDVVKPNQSPADLELDDDDMLDFVF
mmetsp:Transcript_21033/g.54206  ORF Transcript_21033/g.54206 Transcript_21033/m.54206 type:complete len:269 (-) Transcript_21033:73-879(-)